MKSSNTYRDRRLAKRWLVGCAMAGLAFVYFATQMRALDPARTPSHYMREHWGTEKGFPAGTVTAIAQTSDGYLWIGTDEGLIRFDGSMFRSFSQPASVPLAIGAVKKLMTDSEGNLWIVLQSTKTLRYRNGKFETGRDEAEFGITAIGQRRDGAVLLYSLAYGTLTYGKGKFEILQLPTKALANGGSAAANDTLSSRLSWTTSIASHRLAEPDAMVTSVAETSDGRVWLGSQDKGLFSLVNGRVSAVGKGRLSGKIACLLPLEDGKLWIATETGVVEWNGKEFTETDVPSTLRQTQILAMMRDRDANIWLGTNNGLLRVNTNGVSSVDEGAITTTGPITALFEDREANLWAGSPGGIERLRDGAFVTFSVGGLQSESGGPIYVDEQGRAWFAPFEGGLQWLKDGKTGAVTNDGLNQDVVYSITGGKNYLWIGRQRGGLTYLRYDRGSITTKTYTKADGLPDNCVYAVYEARDGTVWAATLANGLSAFSNGHFSTYTTANGMTSDTVVSISEAPDGTMWFATPNGVDALSNGQWRAFTVRDGVPSEKVNCVLSDSAGTLWIGTAAGLAFLRSGRVKPLSTAPPVLHESILGMAEGQNGQLWIATSNHVLSANRSKLLDGSFADSDIRAYGVEDGLLGTEGVTRERSVFRDPFGKVWFSMNRGLSVIDTTRALDTSPPALVHIDALSVDGSPVDPKSSVRVPPGSHRIMFSYSGLSLSVPERVRFKYKLEGFDRDWSEPVSAREAVYTNLDSGAYRFRLIASNSDGLWNSAESSLPIEIRPFFWKTWWFRVSSALLILLVLLAYLRMRTQRLTEHMHMRFEERLAERTRIARELHDSLLQGFQGLLFRLQAARELLPDRPQDAARALDAALDRGDQVIAEGRSTVEDLRDATLRDNDLVEALITLGEELSTSNGSIATAPLRVLVEGKPRELDPVLRDEIYRIAREALRNAFQHARAHRIEAEVEYGDSQFTLRVRDDGNGIDPAVFEAGKRPGHWGLPGMRERAKGFGGQLHVWSESGAGTEVELSVPSSIAYRASSSRSKFRFLRSNTRGSNGRSS